LVSQHDVRDVTPGTIAQTPVSRHLLQGGKISDATTMHANGHEYDHAVLCHDFLLLKRLAYPVEFEWLEIITNRGFCQDLGYFLGLPIDKIPYLWYTSSLIIVAAH